MGDAIAGRPHQVADALKEQRCTELEIEERAEARANRAERRQQEREDAADEERRIAAEQSRQQTQRESHARIRRSPKQPELGGTLTEAATLCRQQSGKVEPFGSGLRCAVGGVLLYACATDTFAGVQRLTRCDVYFEDGDPNAFRETFTARFGPATGESISKGFRVFTWERPGETVAMSMYDKGVRTTIMRTQELSDGGAPESTTPSVGEAANPYVQ